MANQQPTLLLEEIVVVRTVDYLLLGFHQLSKYMLLPILRYLNASSLLNLQASCKALYSLIDHSQFLWDSLCRYSFPYVFPVTNFMAPPIPFYFLRPSMRDRRDTSPPPVNCRELYKHEHKIRVNWWALEHYKQRTGVIYMLLDWNVLLFMVCPVLIFFIDFNLTTRLYCQFVASITALHLEYTCIRNHRQIAPTSDFIQRRPKPSHFYHVEKIAFASFTSVLLSAVFVAFSTLPHPPARLLLLILSFLPYYSHTPTNALYWKQYIISLLQLLFGLLPSNQLTIDLSETISCMSFWIWILLPVCCWCGYKWSRDSPIWEVVTLMITAVIYIIQGYSRHQTVTED